MMDAVALRDPLAVAAACRSQLARFALDCGLDPAVHVFRVRGVLRDDGQVDVEARVSETLHGRLNAADLIPGRLV